MTAFADMPAAWLTVPAAVADYGLSSEVIVHAINSGDITARVLVGERMVRRVEVSALRLHLLADAAERRCAGCE